MKYEVESHDDLPIDDYDLTLMPATDQFDGDIIARKVSTSESILVCSPDYVERRGMPLTPADLASHEMLRLRAPGLMQGVWRLYHPERENEVLDIAVEPGLWVNHTETLMRAVVDGAGITSIVVGLAAPYLKRGRLVRVLRPWITGRLSIYAALPSRRYMPERTRVFLDFLIERARSQQIDAMHACDKC